MAQLDPHQASKIYRGTVEEVFRHRNEIPNGSLVELKVFGEAQEEETTLIDPKAAESIALLRSWIAQAPTDPEGIREAEEDLREFKKNLNQPRKETGARLHFPEAE